MAKLKRSAHILELDAVFMEDGKSTLTGMIIGDDIDDLSVEMNGSFEESKNILGQTRVTDNGYTPTISVESYHCDPKDKLYPYLKDLAMNRKSGVDAKCILREMIVDDGTDVDYANNRIPAEGFCNGWEQYCYVEIVSYGGAAGNALPITYTIHPCGERNMFTDAAISYGNIMGGHLLDMGEALAKEKGLIPKD